MNNDLKDKFNFLSDEVPRVKIKVFQSPSKVENGKQYTTWGFWIKQPAETDLSH